MQRNAKLHLVLIILFFVSVGMPLPSYATDKPAQYHLTILHTNDFHGADYARLAKISAVIKRIRSKEPNVIYLDSGDTFGRGKYHKIFYGELEFAILHAMGCQAMVLGNNEFKATSKPETSHKYLFTRINQATFPVLCANVKVADSKTLLPGVKPYTVLQTGGAKVGIIGFSSGHDEALPQMKGFIVENPVDVAATLIPEMSKKTDIILALTHLGVLEDFLLAGSYDKIQAIIGGHSHNALQEPLDINNIPIVQAGSGGKFLGRLDLYFEVRGGKYTLVKYTGKLIPITPEMTEDPAIRKIIEQYMHSLEKKAA